jgi:hypothetical protein
MIHERNNREGQDENTSRTDNVPSGKTDPQKNMEGPISSLMHETGEAFDSEETKNQAEEEKEKKM